MGHNPYSDIENNSTFEWGYLDDGAELARYNGRLLHRRRGQEDEITRKDEDLREIQAAIIYGGAEPLMTILAEDCVYPSTVGGWEKRGRREVIDLSRLVQNNTTHAYYAHMASVMEEQDSDGDISYKPVERCLVLETEDMGLESILFTEYNEEGLISRITVRNDTKYLLKIDAEKNS